MPATKPFTIATAADFLGCSRGTIRRMVSRGDLKAVRYGKLIPITPETLARAHKPVTSAATLRAGVRR